MSKTMLTSAVLICTVGIGAALAASPHFVGTATSSVDQIGDLSVSFKEAGLGANVTIVYCLGTQSDSATDACYSASSTTQIKASSNYVCKNNGGQCPNAENKQTTNATISVPATFKSGKNGTISQTIKASPPGAGTFSCPSGQTLTLAAVKYTNINLLDYTNNIAATVSPTTQEVSLSPCP